MAQDPWDKDKVVARVRPERGQVVRRQDGSSYVVTNREYTNETPTQLLNQGYVPDENGTYARTTTVPYEDAPWNQDRAVLPSLPVQSDPLSAFASAATEQIPFLDEAAAGVTGLLTGRPYSEVRALQGELRDFDRENYGVARNAGGVAGFAAGIAAPASRGAGVARTALEGSAYGALYGLGAGEGSLADRAPGGVLGAVGGGAVAGGVRAASPYVARLAGIAGNALRGGVSGTAEQRAATRLARTVDDPQAVLAERARLQALGLSPSLADTAPGATERLIRSAAGPAGPAADRAVSNSVQRAANLRPEVMATTRNLTGDPRTAEAYREGLETTRRTMADTMYPDAYATTVEVTPSVMAALTDEPGRAALRRARQAAVARQNTEQVAEIDGLLSGEATTVSAGTLDRVRIAMQGRGAAMNQRPDTRDIAGGLFSRAGQIDEVLDTVPEMAPARETYRNLSGAIEAVDSRPDVFSTDPRDFTAWVRNLTPEQREAAIVGVRQDILDTLGGQRNAGSSSLDRLSQAQYSRQNLSALLGEEEAAQYLGSIEARVQQAQRAARVSPNTNSQTFGRLEDAQTFNAAEALGAVADAGQALGGNLFAIGRLVDRVKARAAMGPEERAAIVEMGLGSADEFERIVRLAEEARAAGRRPPREVRAWVVNATGQLGARSPIALELQRVLLPSRVAASEEETRR